MPEMRWIDMVRCLKIKMEIRMRIINWCICIDDDKLLEKYKTNSIKIKDLKDIELDNLPA